MNAADSDYQTDPYSELRLDTLTDT
jgi:hypothetical protein